MYQILQSPSHSIWKLTCIIGAIIHFSCGDPGPCALIDAGSSSICISLDEINKAFREARLAVELLEPLHFSPLKTHHHHQDIDTFGLVLVETSRILAKTFKLDYEQIFEVLPKVDVELTDIWKFCPAVFKEKSCKISNKYRTITGHCNNLINSDYGAANTPFVYLLPSDRHDGLSEPRDYGRELDPLPSARLISAEIHKDTVSHDHAITIMLIAWGQIIDHDITFTSETKVGPVKDPDCCSENIYESKPPSRHHNCYPIRVPANDDFYSHYHHYCMSFARSNAGVRPGCRLGPRTAFNTISSFLDASFAYGSNIELAAELRDDEGGGKLKTLPLFTEHDLKDLLPLKVEEPDDGCIRPNSDIFCFLAGDTRVNEQLVLTTLHTIFMRQHNEIAHSLAEINQHWDDEKLYQETRRIIIAIVQHITYNEFLPMILGKNLLHEYGLSVEEGYWTGYDPDTNPGALDEFITSAFRFGHSLLPHKIERWSTTHHFIDGTSLHELLRQPFDMFRPGYADTFIMGLVNQFAQVMDEGVTDQVTTLLFKEKGKGFGMDLAAMNIQRGRDHGIPPYAAYRKICGLPPIEDWDDLIGVMRNETVYKYKHLYRSPWDIDLWSGGVSEISKDGALVGPTFGCIISKQFQALRYGDRFWYELPDLPSSFTLDQLNEIKQMKLSRLLCDNGDHLKTIQVYAMVHPDHNINPRVSCHSKALPRIDLEKWRDDSHYDTPKQQSTLQKTHIHTDLEVLKPPLYDRYFVQSKQSQANGTCNNKSPGSSNQNQTKSYKPSKSEGYGDKHKPIKDNPEKENATVDPILLDKIPPFQRIPDDPETTDALKPPNYGTGGDVVVVDHFHDSPPYNFHPHFPPLPPPFRRRRRPSIFNLVRGPNKLLMKIFRRGRKNKRPFRRFPPSPYPTPTYYPG